VWATCPQVQEVMMADALRPSGNANEDLERTVDGQLWANGR
jgi:hypothetical protein